MLVDWYLKGFIIIIKKNRNHLNSNVEIFKKWAISKKNKKIMKKTIFMNYLEFHNAKQEMNLEKINSP